jgi:hypothetical protein
MAIQASEVEAKTIPAENFYPATWLGSSGEEVDGILPKWQGYSVELPGGTTNVMPLRQGRIGRPLGHIYHGLLGRHEGDPPTKLHMWVLGMYPPEGDGRGYDDEVARAYQSLVRHHADGGYAASRELQSDASRNLEIHFIAQRNRRDMAADRASSLIGGHEFYVVMLDQQVAAQYGMDQQVAADEGTTLYRAARLKGIVNVCSGDHGMRDEPVVEDPVTEEDGYLPGFLRVVTGVCAPAAKRIIVPQTSLAR